MKRRILARREVRALELLDRLDQRLRNEAAAELAEVAARVRIAARGHAVTIVFMICAIAANNAAMLAVDP